MAQQSPPKKHKTHAIPGGEKWMAWAKYTIRPFCLDENIFHWVIEGTINEVIKVMILPWRRRRPAFRTCYSSNGLLSKFFEEKKKSKRIWPRKKRYERAGEDSLFVYRFIFSWPRLSPSSFLRASTLCCWTHRRPAVSTCRRGRPPVARYFQVSLQHSLHFQYELCTVGLFALNNKVVWMVVIHWFFSLEWVLKSSESWVIEFSLPTL